MDWLAFTEIVKTIAGIIGILGVPAAYVTYRRSVRTLGQISNEEISGLFEYDLRMIADQQFVVDALRPQGFERLADLIRTAPFLPRR